MNNRVARLRARLATWAGASTAARAGRDRGLLLVGVALFVALLASMLLPHPTLEGTLGITVIAALTMLAVLSLWLVALLLHHTTPRFWFGVLLVVIPGGIALVMGGFAWQGVLALGCLFATGAGLLGGAIGVLRESARSWAARLAAALGALCLLGGVLFLALPGWRTMPARPALPATPPAVLAAVTNPAKRGSFPFEAFTYGSGVDLHRPEYAADARLRSRHVDGSKLIDGWDGAAGWARTRFWGFDATKLPLQGRVWMPAGAGPFPLVLIVHGNHLMQDFSDPGYAYLGEHFASHGIIAISVDENFLNSGDSDLLAGPNGGLDTENDTRGWLLLEHLRQLRDWHAARGNPFSGRIDLQRIALIGHSRGGEAVAEAAHFNRLPAFPDDATLRFDYGFAIRAVIAIAPVDDQYNPRARPTPLHDVSYLVIHGSQDGDVQSFSGQSQYARTSFVDCRRCFKASVYVVGANHGQFNTSWGRADYGPPGSAMLDLGALLDGEAQREVATSLFTAFLQATLTERGDYEAVFRAAPVRAPWLATPVELVIDYASGAEQQLVGYEEDADVTTASWADAQITAQGLSLWQELDPELQWHKRGSAVAVLGWTRRRGAAAPEYRIRFTNPPPATAGLALSVAISSRDPRKNTESPWTPPELLDASLFVVDRAGRTASVPLSRYGGVRAAVVRQTRKWSALDDEDAATEAVLRRIDVPMAAFGNIDGAALRAIGLRFDRSPTGALIVDDFRLRPQGAATTTTAR